MNVTNKLAAFSEVVLKDAEEQRNKILTEMDGVLQSACEKARKEGLELQEITIKNETYKAEQKKNKQLVDAATKNKRNLIALREQKIDELFNTLEKKVREFTNSEEYKNRLLEEIKKSISENSNIVIRLTKNDMKYAEYIKQTIKVEIEESTDDFIGGHKIKFTDKNAIIDNSYRTKLEEEHKKFNLFRI